ncbi:MAG: S53 family peptidase [Phycisphaerae bacterium]
MTKQTRKSDGATRRGNRGAGARGQGLVEGLESRVLLSAAGHTYTNVVSAHGYTGAGSGLSPTEVRQAYGLNQVKFGAVTGDGTGQTIAIVDAYADPTIAADLHTFSAQFGLPDAKLIQVNQRGGPALPGMDPMGPGNSWAMETSLDVEWAHAAAPGATIVLVLANTDSSENLAAAVNTARNYPGVSAVSISWGSTETKGDLAHNSAYTTPAGHTGVTFVVASGDNGAYDSMETVKNVDYPAASPNVLAVGGTKLTVDGAGNYVSESAWGDGARSGMDGGSGGGVSAYQLQPQWQRGVVTQTKVKRALPDVSIVGDPATGVAVVDSYDSPSNPWMKIGGTSLGAPLWAGMVAIANQGRGLAGKGTLDGTQTLSAIYAAPPTFFHDITTGNNGYAATAGFDLATGRGTPIAQQLVPFMASFGGTAAKAKPAPTPKVGTVVVKKSNGPQVTLTALNVQDAGGRVKTVKFYRESNRVAGLQMAKDTLVGFAVKKGANWTLTTRTTAAGNYTYYAVVVDVSGTTSTPLAVTLHVVRPTVAASARA